MRGRSEIQTACGCDSWSDHYGYSVIDGLFLDFKFPVDHVWRKYCAFADRTTFGDSANGAARWIDFGFIRFQPTELSKIIIILFFARFFMDHEEDLNTFKTLAKSVILLAIPLFLIYEQPDMKNTLMLLAVFCILIYIAGLSYKIIGGMFLIIIPLAIIFVSIVVQPDQKLIKDYQRKRIMAFLYPENEEYSDDIEQQNNSKTAIASGELIGKNCLVIKKLHL